MRESDRDEVGLEVPHSSKKHTYSNSQPPNDIIRTLLFPVQT